MITPFLFVAAVIIGLIWAFRDNPDWQEYSYWDQDEWEEDEHDRLPD